MTDPIADMLSRIRNALLVKKTEVFVPYSGLKFEIANLMQKKGFLDKVEKINEKFDLIKISLKYNADQTPAISHIKRVSRPGRRIYLTKNHLPIVLNNYGVAVISTSAGLMTNKEAKKKGIGGEIICEIY
ncbi:MAG: 30S ribosomal protein S8 [Patescibacteria group bacterium]